MRWNIFAANFLITSIIQIECWFKTFRILIIDFPDASKGCVWSAYLSNLDAKLTFFWLKSFSVKISAVNKSCVGVEVFSSFYLGFWKKSAWEEQAKLNQVGKSNIQYKWEKIFLFQPYASFAIKKSRILYFISSIELYIDYNTCYRVAQTLVLDARAFKSQRELLLD